MGRLQHPGNVQKVLISVVSTGWEGKTDRLWRKHTSARTAAYPVLPPRQVPAAVRLHQVFQAQSWHVQPQKLHQLHEGARKHIQICIQQGADGGHGQGPVMLPAGDENTASN